MSVEITQAHRDAFKTWAASAGLATNTTEIGAFESQQARQAWFHWLLFLKTGALALPDAPPSQDAVRSPMCRDCADFGPICPNSGRPCGSKDDARAAIAQEKP